jgi:hypothetical protein
VAPAANFSRRLVSESLFLTEASMGALVSSLVCSCVWEGINACMHACVCVYACVCLCELCANLCARAVCALCAVRCVCVCVCLCKHVHLHIAYVKKEAVRVVSCNRKGVPCDHAAVPSLLRSTLQPEITAQSIGTSRGALTVC